MIAIVRHGAREDHDGYPNRKRKSEIKQDPALSGLGEDQSRMTGRYFAEKYLSKQNYAKRSNIRVISSPFLRTLQTAVNIAREINCQRIQVWDPICEELGSDIFDSFPLPHINYYMHNSNFLCDKFLGGKDVEVIEMHDPEEIMSSCHYPEKKGNKQSNDSEARARNALDYLIKTQFSRVINNTNQCVTFEESASEDSCEIIILVTHAFFLNPFVKYFSPRSIYKDRDYCALAVAQKINFNDWKLVENCSSEHLT